MIFRLWLIPLRDHKRYPLRRSQFRLRLTTIRLLRHLPQLPCLQHHSLAGVLLVVTLTRGCVWEDRTIGAMLEAQSTVSPRLPVLPQADLLLASVQELVDAAAVAVEGDRLMDLVMAMELTDRITAEQAMASGLTVVQHTRGLPTMAVPEQAAVETLTQTTSVRVTTGTPTPVMLDSRGIATEVPGITRDIRASTATRTFPGSRFHVTD